MRTACAGRGQRLPHATRRRTSRACRILCVHAALLALYTPMPSAA